MAALLNSAYLYVGSDKWTSVTAWATGASKSVGNLVRQNTTPTLGNERVFVCIVAGTTNATTEPTWTVTKGAKTTDNTVTWQECTGQPPVNGDATNTLNWNSAKSNTVALGQIIQNIAGTFYFICSTAGTSGSGAEPSWTLTAGVTTADNTVTWTCIGAVGAFAAFAAPHKRVLNADAATWSTVAGSISFISSGHAETQSSALSLSGGQGTNTNPTRYLCVGNSTAPPTATTTGATISTTGASALAVTGASFWEGVSFLSGSATSTASLTVGNSVGASIALYFENCNFKLNNSSISSSLIIGTANTLNDYILNFLNCTFVFGSVSQSLSLKAGQLNIIGGSIAASGSAPVTLLSINSSSLSFSSTIRDCDLSAITGTLFGSTSTATGFVAVENCKLGTAVTMGGSGVSSGPGGPVLKLHNCDNGSKNYRFFESAFFATIQQETTTINTAGASDGTQGISWNVATNVRPSFGQPYVCPEITQWQDTTGSSKTATVEIAGSSTLTNADIWMELEYPGNASFPLGSVVNNRATDILATPSNVTSSSASWGGSPAHTQKLQVTFTPQMKGPIKARIYVAKASTTVFIDPLITVT